MQIAAVRRARHGAACCGDVTASWRDGPRTTLFIADGLGHGELAEQAARAARDYVDVHQSQPFPDMFCGCDAALRNTRGAAMAVAVLDKSVGTISYLGVGNTRGRILGEKTVCLYSHAGIVGGGVRNLTVITKSIHPGDLVLMWTDGIEESIDLSFIRRLVNHHDRSYDWIGVANYVLDKYYFEADDVAVLVCGSEGVLKKGSDPFDVP